MAQILALGCSTPRWNGKAENLKFNRLLKGKVRLIRDGERVPRSTFSRVSRENLISDEALLCARKLLALLKKDTLGEFATLSLDALGNTSFKKYTQMFSTCLNCICFRGL